MTYIENIFICMVSPLLVAALCMGRRQLRFFLFCIAGMGVCLLSAYINTFLAAVCQADALAATAEIAPVVEEIMKLLPLVFYLLVFEPEGDRIKAAAITVALSFATFENVCSVSYTHLDVYKRQRLCRKSRLRKTSASWTMISAKAALRPSSDVYKRQGLQGARHRASQGHGI